MKLIIPGNIDVMVIGESKLDDSYPISQFLIDGCSEPFRLDRNCNGGGGGGGFSYTLGKISLVNNYLIIHYRMILRVCLLN